MEKAKIIKITRTLIRLKHSLKADEELNAVLPGTLAEFDSGLCLGELRGLVLELSDVLE